MARFNTSDWFRSLDAPGSTRVKADGHTLSLDGVPEEYTVDGLVELAVTRHGEENPAKLQGPEMAVGERLSVRPRRLLTGEQAACFIIGEAPAEKPTARPEVKAALESSNGKAHA